MNRGLSESLGLPYNEPAPKPLTDDEREECRRLDALYYLDINGARACDCLGSGWIIRHLPDGRLAIEGPNLGVAEVRS